MILNKGLYIQLAAILLFTGCVSQPVKRSENQSDIQSVKEPVKQSVIRKRQTSTEPSAVELTYLNSNVFDQGVASNMIVGNRTIHVKFPVRFTLNSIPERIDKWLTEIVNNNGSVELEALKEPDAEYRSFSLVASLVKIGISVYARATKDNLYEVSENYNGKIIYEPETGEILEILLFPREQNEG